MWVESGLLVEEGTLTSERVFVITGANSGIGRATTMELAKLGATVVMVCRDQGRGEAALKEIKEASGGTGAVELMLADLSSQKSIRRFVEVFRGRYDRLHVLINNAAAFLDRTLKNRTLTEEGFEVIFATNHLGPFLMTNLLLDLLKACTPSRVLNIASLGLACYPRLTIEFDNLNSRKKYRPGRAYYHSKLAQIMFTYDLARRLNGTGVTANCIRVPGVKLDSKRLDHLARHLRFLYSIKRRFLISPQEIAKTYVYLATSSEMEKVSGKYFDQNRREVRSSKHSYDQALWERLWKVSEELTGFSSLS